jgi:putative SOS response-associated peptidase YedK
MPNGVPQSDRSCVGIKYADPHSVRREVTVCSAFNTKFEIPPGAPDYDVQDPKAGPPLIKARSETIATKPSFRTAFKRQRCLIPAAGFYEWQKKADSKTKIPHYIRMAKVRPFAFAGLWETWRRSPRAK